MEKRILSLERNLRVHRYFFGILAVLFVTLAAVGAQQANRPPSKPFTIYDSNGKLRVHLTLNKDTLETPGLWFLDSEENRRLYLGLNKNDDPGIFFYDRAGEFAWVKVEEGGAVRGDDPGAPSSTPEIKWPRDNMLIRVNNWNESKYFHKADCGELYGTIRKGYVSEARKRGLKPCPKCFPECYE